MEGHFIGQYLNPANQVSEKILDNLFDVKGINRFVPDDIKETTVSIDVIDFMSTFFINHNVEVDLSQKRKKEEQQFEILLKVSNNQHTL